MLFPTIDFLLFFSFVFPATWSLNRNNRLKKFFLVVCSYIFYSFWNWHFIFLLFFSSALNYAVGRFLGYVRPAQARKFVTAFGVAANLAILGYWKNGWV